MDEVTYGELEKEEAQPIVTKYKEEARKLLPPSEKRTNRRNNRNKRNRQNRSRGQGYGESWNLPAPNLSLSFVLSTARPSEKPGNQDRLLTTRKCLFYGAYFFLCHLSPAAAYVFSITPQRKKSLFNKNVSLQSSAVPSGLSSFHINMGSSLHRVCVLGGFMQ